MRQFQALITQEGKYFVAKNLDIGVVSQGLSLNESLDNLKEATELYLEDNTSMMNSQSPQAYLTTITL